jgi:hypothetical protein
MNITGALVEGEITLHEFAVLAWLERWGEWHGHTAELHTLLQWPHTVKHLRDDVLRQLRERGLIRSTMRDRSSRPYTLAVADRVAVADQVQVADVADAASLEQEVSGRPAEGSGGRHPPMSNGSTLNVEPNALSSKGTTRNALHAPLIGSGIEGLDWEAEREAPRGGRSAAFNAEQWDAQVDAAWQARKGET